MEQAGIKNGTISRQINDWEEADWWKEAEEAEQTAQEIDPDIIWEAQMIGVTNPLASDDFREYI